MQLLNEPKIKVTIDIVCDMHEYYNTHSKHTIMHVGILTD